MATGKLTRVSPNTIVADFSVRGFQWTFKATVHPALPPFTSSHATLTHGGERDLKGTHFFSGMIGTTTFRLTLDNGVVMQGELDMPGVDPPSMVDGSGEWEPNPRRLSGEWESS